MTAPDAPLLTIVWHSRTGAAKALAAAAAEGARAAGVARVQLMAAADASAGCLLAAQAFLFACPENLASMSGAMKEMFDRAYYPLLGRVEGRAYATIIAAGSDGHGAQAQLDRIATGWRLRRVAEPMICHLHAQTPESILAPKQVAAEALANARALGALLAEGIAAGIF
ncbi:MAG: flavodoxin family protein [Sphingomonadales bacterium]|nr:flavodoxin family protein [Sphingomonadales bacterium]